MRVPASEHMHKPVAADYVSDSVGGPLHGRLLLGLDPSKNRGHAVEILFHFEQTRL